MVIISYGSSEHDAHLQSKIEYDAATEAYKMSQPDQISLFTQSVSAEFGATILLSTMAIPFRRSTGLDKILSLSVSRKTLTDTPECCGYVSAVV